jgi:hypothetical protein
VILRAGLLDGVGLVVAGAGSLGAAVEARCAALGADCAGEEAEVLVWDGAAAFVARSGVEAVRAALDGGWDAILAGRRLLLRLPLRSRPSVELRAPEAN